jgi:hypothetical protein
MRSSWRRIIPLVADGLEVTSGNCLSDELLRRSSQLFPKVADYSHQPARTLRAGETGLPALLAPAIIPHGRFRR